jgi:hypothetical protein
MPALSVVVLQGLLSGLNKGVVGDSTAERAEKLVMQLLC